MMIGEEACDLLWRGPLPRVIEEAEGHPDGRLWKGLLSCGRSLTAATPGWE